MKGMKAWRYGLSLCVDMTETIHRLLECRVPRMYTVESDGSVNAEMRDGDAFLGTGVQTHRLTTSTQALQRRMSEEVISTLQQWFKNYERCKVCRTVDWQCVDDG